MAMEGKGTPQFLQEQANMRWEALLKDIFQFLRSRKLTKNVFINYLLPSEKEEKEILLSFLERLKDCFQQVGLHIFLGITRNELVSHVHLSKQTPVVILILTPSFKEQLENSALDDSRVEFQWIVKNAQENQITLLPILYAEQAPERFFTGILSPLAQYPVCTIPPYGTTQLEPYLVGQSDSLGLIPRICGIEPDDPGYQNLLLTWLENSLLPLKLSVSLDNPYEASSVEYFPSIETFTKKKFVQREEERLSIFRLESNGFTSLLRPKDYIATCVPQAQCVGLEALIQELVDEPLALSYAIAYMKQNRQTAEEYLESYIKEKMDLTNAETKNEETESIQHDIAISAAYRLSIKRLAEENPIAVKLVKFCAYVDQTNIQESFLKSVLEPIDDALFNACIRLLERYHLLSKKGVYFEIHPKVQEVILAQESPGKKRKRMSSIAVCLTQLNEKYQDQSFLPHLKKIISHYSRAKFEDENRVVLLTHFAYLSFYSEPESIIAQLTSYVFLKEARELGVKFYGRDHVNMAQILTNLAFFADKLGKFDEKLIYLIEAGDVRERLYLRESTDNNALNLSKALARLAATAPVEEEEEKAHVLRLAKRAYNLMESHYGAENLETQECVRYLNSTCQFTLEDLSHTEEAEEKISRTSSKYQITFFKKRRPEENSDATNTKQKPRSPCCAIS